MSPRAFLIVFAAIAAIAASWYGTGRTAAEPAYRFGKVDRGDISDIVTATGTLNAVTTVQIGSQVSGRIAAIHADFNDRVKKGDVLAQIDPTPFEAQVAQAEGNSTKARAASQRTSAAVEVARANELIAASEVVSSQASLNKAQVLAENAERTWNRVRELEQRKMMSRSELDGAQTELARAKAEVRAAAAQVESARARAGASQSQVRQALAETEANRGEVALAEA
ncbi:MAG: biotin/lipoyl-binding protein, partial [Candidatus Wallbacteria bacterium]|nr:biotin/lipoyl-binding protein [Candidatus Wallbacteria bacterium]